MITPILLGLGILLILARSAEGLTDTLKRLERRGLGSVAGEEDDVEVRRTSAYQKGLQ